MTPDTGEADPRLQQALQGYERAEVLAAFVGARVFAGITATSTAEHVEAGTGLRAESSAEMAVVLLEGDDGSRALPVFSSLTALRRWRLDARPVPLTGAQACSAALDEGAIAVVLDGVLTVVELTDLAHGFVPVAGTQLAARHADTELVAPTGAVPPELAPALARALAGEGLLSARLLQGAEGLVVGVTPPRPLPPAELAALAHRVVTALGPTLPAEGLDLAQVPPDGPGLDLLPKRRRGFRTGQRR